MNKKIIAIGSVLCLLSNQLIIPIAYADNKADFLSFSDNADVMTLKQYLIDNNITNPLVSNILAKDIPLTKYEVTVISEVIKQEMQDRITKKQNTREDLIRVLEVQNKYPDVYKSIFNKSPVKVEENINIPLPQGDAISQEELESIPSQLTEQDLSESFNNLVANIPKGKKYSNVPIYDDQEPDYQQTVANAQTPEELTDATSLINIGEGKHPYKSSSNPNEITPASDFESVAKYTQGASSNIYGEEPETDSLLDDINNNILARAIKKAKDYRIFVVHNLTYIKEKGEGNVPYDTSYTNDLGEYYVPTVTDQYQLEESLDIGIGFTLFKTIDAVIGLVAKNENGLLWQNGTSWGFDVLSLKFKPQQKVKNKTGVDIQNGGKVVGKQVGNGTYIAGDTTSGDVGVTVGNEAGTVQYDYNTNSLSAVSSDNSKYYMNLGNLSLNLSSYTLKLSDCRAIQLGYKDNDVEIMGIYANPSKLAEGYDNKSGTYKKYVWAGQYVAKNLFSHLNLALNFAFAKDEGELNNPNGASKDKTTVYSIVVKSKNIPNTSFQGEFARSENIYDYENNAKKVIANADYFDITHRFSNRLNGSLHLINIDGTYDADSLVEDRTGDYLLTTNTGDGLADYLYKTGQKGFDLTLNYRFPENASIAFGLSRYSLTSDGNSKTNYYLAGEKSWSFTNANGDNVANIGIQQRFEYNKVFESNINQQATKRISDTTVSVDATPWKDGELQSNLQLIRNNYEGDENRFDLTLAHNFYPIERVRITPKVKYSRKKGEVGLDGQEAVDTTTLINSLTIGYELVPDELVVNMMVSKEKYDVISSEIDKTTEAKVDGENRSLIGAGIGLVWQPKKIAGLTASISYRKDSVDYVTPQPDHSNQDIWDMSVRYEMPINNNIKASISYDYKTVRDRIKPIYDEVTRTVAIDVDATINNHSTFKIQHAFNSEYKPLDPKQNYKTQTTSIVIRNSF